DGRGWTFEGGTYEHSEIPVGVWIGAIQQRFAANRDIPLPDSILDLVLLDLGVRINATTEEYSFQATAKFPIYESAKKFDNDKSLAIVTVQLDLVGGVATFRGLLTVLEREFSIAFSSRGILVASYDGSQVQGLKLQELLNQFAPELGKLVGA